METIIPQAETIEFLKQLELKDLFPKSIDSLHDNNKNNSEKKSTYSLNEKSNLEFQSIKDEKSNEMEIDQKYKLSKTEKELFLIIIFF